MSKQILVLAGSPRKGGNSDKLCDQFIKGSIESGNTAEKIYVHKQEIKSCMGCHYCMDRSTCVQKDDMESILDKMINADVIVLSTPVYFYSMDGQMKTLIDRTFPRYTEIKNKDFYFIATAADGKDYMERTIDGLRGFTDCLPDAKVKGIVYGYGVGKIGDIEGTKAMDEAYVLGKGI